MNNFFWTISFAIISSAFLALLARKLKQPILLAYLAAGVIGSALHLYTPDQGDSFHSLADIGVMLLLFMIGMEINYSSLKTVGRTSILLGTGQVIGTSGVGYLIANFLGFDPLPSFYIATALTFSSTIIIVKLLSDKKDLNSLYGKLSIGILLVQDLVAILILMTLPSLNSPELSSNRLLGLVATVVALFVLMLFLGSEVLPPIFRLASKSPELLFIVSLAWVLLVAVLIDKLGLSLQIGGLMAGIALANSSEHFQIASRIRPLRDFFLVIFFFTLGASLHLGNIGTLMLPISIFSLFVLIGNPLIVFFLMALMGYRKRTSFLAGMSLGQVSEFSLILIALGFTLGHIEESIVTIVTAAGIISIVVSTYLIVHSEFIFRKLSRILAFFEREQDQEPSLSSKDSKKPIVLIGYHRMGQSIAQSLNREDLLVIDFDPEIMPTLKTQGLTYIFGDIKDEDIIEEAKLHRAKIVISTSPDPEDTLSLLSIIKSFKKKPFTIVRAETEHDAREFYSQGANYVLLPHISSGQYLGHLLASDPTLRLLRKLNRDNIFAQ